MPKIVTRAVVSTNQTDEDNKSLSIYYCLCGQWAVICDQNLETLPRRSTDGAYIVDVRQHVCKLNTSSDGSNNEVVVIRRADGLEGQSRLLCQKCSLMLAYRSTDTENAAKYIYIPTEGISSANNGWNATKNYVHGGEDNDKEIKEGLKEEGNEDEEAATEANIMEFNYKANAAIIEKMTGASTKQKRLLQEQDERKRRRTKIGTL